MKPYGCNNSERKPGYYAPNRIHHADGCFVVVASWIEDQATTACQYRKETPNDPRCEGCKK